MSSTPALRSILKLTSETAGRPGSCGGPGGSGATGGALGRVAISLEPGGGALASTRETSALRSRFSARSSSTLDCRPEIMRSRSAFEGAGWSAGADWADAAAHGVSVARPASRVVASRCRFSLAARETRGRFSLRAAMVIG